MVRISVELPDEVAEALARAAAESQSTREALVVEATRGFLEERDDPEFDAFVASGAYAAWIAEAEAEGAVGRGYYAGEVFDSLHKSITAAETRKRA